MSQRTVVGRRAFLRLAMTAAGAAGLEGVAPGIAGAATKAPEKLGAQYIGKLEGPEIIRDAAKFPKQFSEAPVLADLVKAGRLPPVERRLPEPADLMVVKPLKEIGKYGGRWRRGFTGPADNENGNRICSTDKILMWDYTGNKVVPCLVKDWRLSDDGKIMTLFLRKGLKWSDGQPFTADDFLFWYTDIYQNKELVPTPVQEFTVGGKPGRLAKRDDYTVMFEFPDPYFLFVDILAGAFAAGTQQVNVVVDPPFGLGPSRLWAITFHVVPPPEIAIFPRPPKPLTNYSGLWWNPGESGWGLSIQQSATSRIFAAWYVYDEDRPGGAPAFPMPGPADAASAEGRA